MIRRFSILLLGTLLFFNVHVQGQNHEDFELIVPEKAIYDTGFVSPNGRYLISYSKSKFSNGPIAVWELESGKQVALIARSATWAHRIMNDSFLVFATDDNNESKVVIWNTQVAGVQKIKFYPDYNVWKIYNTSHTNNLMIKFKPNSIEDSYEHMYTELYDPKSETILKSWSAVDVKVGIGATFLVESKLPNTTEVCSWATGEKLKEFPDSQKSELANWVQNYRDNFQPKDTVKADYLEINNLGLTYQTDVWKTKIWLSDKIKNHRLQEFTGYSNDYSVAVINRDGSTLVTVHPDQTKVWDFKTGHYLRKLDYAAFEEQGVHIQGYLSDISPNGDYIILGGNKFFSSRTGAVFGDLNVAVSMNNSEVSNNNKFVVVSTVDSNAYIFDLQSRTLLRTIRTNARVSDCIFSSDSKLLAVSWPNHTEVIELTSFKTISAFPYGSTWGYGTFLAFHPNEKLLAIDDGNEVEICDLVSGEVLKSLYISTNGVLFSPDGAYLLCNSSNSDGASARFTLYRTDTWEKYFSSLPGHKIEPTNAIVFSANSKYLRSFSGNDAYIWDIASGKIKHALKGHDWNVSLAVFSTDGNFVLTTSWDKTVRLWDTETGAEMLRLYTFDGEDYIHIHPSGLFDGTPGALEKVFFRRGTEIIELAQLKDRYYEPSLWEKVLKGEKLRDVRGLNQLKLEPTIKLQPIIKGALPIQLMKREGGYGKVSVFINGKEVVADARGRGFDTTKTDQMVQVMIDGHPFLVPGADNEIIVKTWSADGFVEGRGARVTYKDPRSTNTEPPSFYAVICGVSEYQNKQLNLAFAITDANAVSNAVKKGAENLFGVDRTFIYNLTSPGPLPPTKINIQNAFADIRKLAKPQDIVFVYLSGHGIVWGGESADFYYLTSDAYSLSTESYNDPAIRAKNTVSTAEFTQWINSISALKQVMVIDACGSGQAVDNLLASRSVDASQVRAIDRMKDRTGMYLLSGCAADAVSYEASKYGQGLLTYALLQGMKGAALKENKFLDVAILMNHARESVPVMAYGIGGIQTPQLLIPKGGSFDIGMFNDGDKAAIQLASPKPVFVRSLFIDARAKRDKIGMSKAINEMLVEESGSGASAAYLYFDADEYTDGYMISGDYTVTESTIEVELVISKGDDEYARIKLVATDISGILDQLKARIPELGLQ